MQTGELESGISVLLTGASLSYDSSSGKFRALGK